MAGGLAWAQAPGGPGMGPGGAGPGFAQHRAPMEKAFGFDGAHGQFWNNPRIVEQLKLTDDQRKAMDGILQDHRMKLIDLRASLEKAEVAMVPLMKADTPNRGAIEAQIDKIVQARADLEKATARFLLDIRMQLNPDQWKQLQTKRDERMGRDGRGWGGPGMRGPGGQFRQRQEPPPAGAAPEGAPPAPPAAGSQPSGSGENQ